jgi:hypothetical protein
MQFKNISRHKKVYIILDNQDIKNPHFNVIDFIDKIKLKKSNFYDTELYTVILDAPDDAVKEIKAGLLSKDIYFNDGHEHIKFSPSYFQRPFHFKTQYNNRGHKIDDASFFIRVVSLKTVLENHEKIAIPDYIFSTKKDLHHDFFKQITINLICTDIVNLVKLVE